MTFPWLNIGPVISASLMARLPELGRLDRRSVASLAGLAPKTRQSGKFKGKSRIGRGRNTVRSQLYLAAMTVWRSQSDRAARIHRPQAAGKAPKVVQIAIARKIATIANAVIRDQKPFNDAV